MNFTWDYVKLAAIMIIAGAGIYLAGNCCTGPGTHSEEYEAGWRAGMRCGMEIADSTNLIYYPLEDYIDIDFDTVYGPVVAFNWDSTLNHATFVGVHVNLRGVQVVRDTVWMYPEDGRLNILPPGNLFY